MTTIAVSMLLLLYKRRFAHLLEEVDASGCCGRRGQAHVEAVVIVIALVLSFSVVLVCIIPHPHVPFTQHLCSSRDSCAQWSVLTN